MAFSLIRSPQRSNTAGTYALAQIGSIRVACDVNTADHRQSSGGVNFHASSVAENAGGFVLGTKLLLWQLGGRIYFLAGRGARCSKVKDAE